MLGGVFALCTAPWQNCHLSMSHPSQRSRGSGVCCWPASCRTTSASNAATTTDRQLNSTLRPQFSPYEKAVARRYLYEPHCIEPECKKATLHQPKLGNALPVLRVVQARLPGGACGQVDREVSRPCAGRSLSCSSERMFTAPV